MNLLFSRTDLSIAQEPVMPAAGPAGSIITDPLFSNPMIRATDGLTASGKSWGAWFTAGRGGSADVNTWNLDSTMLAVEDAGGGTVILGFNPSVWAIARIFPGWRASGAVVFSRVDPNVAFCLQGTQFVQYDLSDRAASVPPAGTIICDFAPQLPAAMTWESVGGVESGDTIFSAGFSTAGEQGTGLYVCAYKVGCGFRTWNTGTGQVSGTYGPMGAVTYPARFTVHNVKANRTGQWLCVTMTTMMSNGGGPNHGPFFWNLDTLLVNNIGTIAPGGHWTAGFCEHYNFDSNSAFDIPYGAHVRRSLWDLNNPSAIANPCPEASAMVGLDDHPSMNGPGSGNVLITSTCKVLTPGATIPLYPAAWYNEVLVFDLSGTGKVWRLCHTRASGNTGNFYADNGIATGSQDNKFVAFTTDWRGGLGGRQADVFIVPLR